MSTTVEKTAQGAQTEEAEKQAAQAVLADKQTDETSEETQPKRRWEMPHLLWLMLIILAAATAAGYLIPAGEFQKNPDGSINPNDFRFLEDQSPVSPFGALMMLLTGAVNMAPIAFAVLSVGANVSVVLESKAFENLLDSAVYRLQDKSTPLLVSGLFCLMVYIGGFSGNDALIAIVPIGVLFARKLGLDGIVAVAVTTFAALIGFGTGPKHMAVSQMLIGLPPYSGFGMRMIIMNLFMVVGLAFVLLYVRRIQKDPTRSLMWKHGWRPHGAVGGHEAAAEAGGEAGTVAPTKLRLRSVIVLALFIAQFGVVVGYSLLVDSKQVIEVMFATNLVSAIIIGKAAGFKWNPLAETIARGISSMGFIAIIIGMAGSISALLAEAKILDTIVYTLTLPLRDVGLGWSAVLMVLLFAAINFIIPSTAAKAAILLPLLAPIATALGMHHQLALQAFQLGDGLTNILSPVLAWLVGSCVTAGVPYLTWVRWAAPKIGVFLVMAAALMLGLTALGWTGGVA
ncbi:AbgT family transporter [Brevibacterium sp. HMSC063G07]|uniref:AbgT family transporter n=1 Tax=Brevibacterium sp. HMSC063G07 TaxID=1739261 RepID=UPI0008A40710|nr:AbgT family transporter [Brevibacterium sp. HMSC063G07]OFL66327.1 hypothetical protein HMPREF2757_02880 [Brevibacterium sp. HMSC063G07]